jgi:signal transduction histidine kinase
MWDVLKGALTRHMLILFVGLALLPLLILGVVSGILQVQTQQRAVRALEADLREKASSQFQAQARSKANYLEQILTHRTAVAVLLAEQGQRLYEGEAKGAVSTGQQLAEALTAMRWSVSQDKAVRSAFISLRERGEWAAPSYSGRIDHDRLFADWDPANPPASGEPTDVAWRLTYTGQGALLVLASPVWAGDRAVGIAGLELWLDRVIEEVPRDGLVERSSLLLIAPDTRFLALQSWDPDSFRWSRLPPLAFKAGRPLSEFLPDEAAQALVTGGLQPHLSQRKPLVLPVSLEDQSAFMAFQTVGGTPLVAVLVLPLTEVWNLAEYYGAPLHVAIVPVVIELAVSAIFLVLAISLGAVFTLRQIAQPIRDLSIGASEVMQGRFMHRVRQEGPDELKDLAGSFNRMAEVVGQAQNDLENKRAELAQALANRQRQFDVINKVASVTNYTTDLSGKLSSVLDVVGPALAIDEGAVVLVEDGDRLSPMAHRVNTQADTKKESFVVRHEGLLRSALEDDSLYQERSLPSGADGMTGWCVAVPLRMRGARRGAIVLERRQPQSFDADTVTFLQALATHVAILVDNAHLQSELRYVTLWEERRRLARELHDSVTQTVFTLSLAAEGIKANLGDTTPEVREALDFLTAQAGRARQEMRGLINELRPIDLGNQSLDQAIRIHAASLQRAAGLQVTTTLNGDIRGLPPLIQHNMNRVLQEALSNVMRHARASHALIELSVDGCHALLRVADDGRGFAAPDVSREQMGSLGLISMRERVEAMGGSLEIESTIGRGTAVIVRVPLQPAQEESASG